MESETGKKNLRWSWAIARKSDRKTETGQFEMSGLGPSLNLKPEIETGIQNPGWSQAIAREPRWKLEIIN